MSGHSKWANIKHKKGAADAARGKIFTKHAKLIEIAAREGGGGDSDMNPRLAAAIENAKADNLPNINIDRAVKKGSGELKGEVTAEVIYEAYAPGGAACIIECLTDNKNRTLNNVRSIIERHGGKWAVSGAVMFLFTKKGVITAQGSIDDALELELIDAGAQDIERDGDTVTVTTEMGSWTEARDLLKGKGLELQESGLKYIALQDVVISDAQSAKKLMEFVEAIEEDEDVSQVHTNAEISDEVVGLIG